MDIIEEAELAVAKLQAIVREDMAKAEQEWQDKKKPNVERLRALGMIN